MNLSKRLQLVASFVSDNSNIIDVGCDHAHLSIYLCNNLKNIKVTASDIREKPLQIASDNIKKYHLEDKIKTVLKDGINDLDESIDTVIISGMGGILISKIINNKKDLTNVKNLILSPNNDFPIVRKTLRKMGFKIIKEKLITENNITYLVILAKKGFDFSSLFFGKLRPDNLEVIYYYTSLLNNNISILKKIPKKYFKKRFKLIFENYKIKKFLNQEIGK